MIGSSLGWITQFHDSLGVDYLVTCSFERDVTWFQVSFGRLGTWFRNSLGIVSLRFISLDKELLGSKLVQMSCYLVPDQFGRCVTWSYVIWACCYLVSIQFQARCLISSQFQTLCYLVPRQFGHEVTWFQVANLVPIQFGRVVTCLQVSLDMVLHGSKSVLDVKLHDQVSFDAELHDSSQFGH